MKKKNIDIRIAIEVSKLKYWEIAQSLGMTDGMFSKLLRFELSSEKKHEILKIIERLKREEK